VTEYYFDIETWDPNASGRPDPKKGQVIVVAYQPMSFGMPRGDLQIKSAWAGGGEKTVLQHVLDLGVFDCGPRCFDFVPVGTNLTFDFAFLMERMHLTDVRRFGREEVLEILREKPRIDIKTTLLLMNDGKFKGSGLDSFTRLKRSGGVAVLKLWERKDYRAIEEYVRSDAAGFFDVYQKILPTLLEFGRKVRPLEKKSRT
jgi:hypothetical protein